MEKANEKAKKDVCGFDFEMLFGALRYYEHRNTAASACFPGDVVSRYWASGEYSANALTRIAWQFAKVDHGRRGEADWLGDRFPPDCNRTVWCKFYAFCKAWCDGFTSLAVKRGGEFHEMPAFWCDCTHRWYLREEYVKNPSCEVYVAAQYGADGGAKEEANK